MDLLQSQIKESCSLALPEGLKDLMSDISREVLRIQPNNMPQFIADYLEVLLEVRENLSIACHICNDTCKNICDHQLYDELKAIGFSDENIETAINIIEEHLSHRNVKEENLLIKLSKNISIDETQLPSLRDAIKKAFKQHHNKGILGGIANKNSIVTDALHFTLDWYKQNKATEEVFVAPNLDPCMSTVSSTRDLDRDSGSYLNLLKDRKCSIDKPKKENEHASYEHTLDSMSTGKVKFMEEKGIFKIINSGKEEPGTSDVNNVYVCDDNIDNKHHYNDYMAGDENGIIEEADLTDDDIEENIMSANDDTISSVDEETAQSE